MSMRTSSMQGDDYINKYSIDIGYLLQLHVCAVESLCWQMPGPISDLTTMPAGSGSGSPPLSRRPRRNTTSCIKTGRRGAAAAPWTTVAPPPSGYMTRSATYWSFPESGGALWPERAGAARQD